MRMSFDLERFSSNKVPPRSRGTLSYGKFNHEVYKRGELFVVSMILNMKLLQVANNAKVTIRLASI